MQAEAVEKIALQKYIATKRTIAERKGRDLRPSAHEEHMRRRLDGLAAMLEGRHDAPLGVIPADAPPPSPERRHGGLGGGLGGGIPQGGGMSGGPAAAVADAHGRLPPLRVPPGVRLPVRDPAQLADANEARQASRRVKRWQPGEGRSEPQPRQRPVAPATQLVPAPAPTAYVAKAEGRVAEGRVANGHGAGSGEGALDSQLDELNAKMSAMEQAVRDLRTELRTELRTSPPHAAYRPPPSDRGGDGAESAQLGAIREQLEQLLALHRATRVMSDAERAEAAAQERQLGLLRLEREHMARWQHEQQQREQQRQAAEAERSQQAINPYAAVGAHQQTRSQLLPTRIYQAPQQQVQQAQPHPPEARQQQPLSQAPQPVPFPSSRGLQLVPAANRRQYQ